MSIIINAHKILHSAYAKACNHLVRKQLAPAVMNWTYNAGRWWRVSFTSWLFIVCQQQMVSRDRCVDRTSSSSVGLWLTTQLQGRTHSQCRRPVLEALSFIHSFIHHAFTRAVCPPAIYHDMLLYTHYKRPHYAVFCSAPQRLSGPKCGMPKTRKYETRLKNIICLSRRTNLTINAGLENWLKTCI